jgi:hypothetical protein
MGHLILGTCARENLHYLILPFEKIVLNGRRDVPGERRRPLSRVSSRFLLELTLTERVSVDRYAGMEPWQVPVPLWRIMGICAGMYSCLS